MQENFDSIPASLKALPNWVGFRVWRDEKDNKYKKMPVDIVATIAAKKADPTAWKDIPAESNNPKTWCDYETAEMWLKNKKPNKKYAWHIGFAFDGSGIMGIDLDHCVDKAGSISDFAKGILTEVQSYTEYSPSGTGLHILAICTTPFHSGGLHQKEIEMYQNGRFFTMTGNHFESSTKDIVDCTDTILSLYEKSKCSLNTENVEVQLLPMNPKEASSIRKLKFSEASCDLSDEEIVRRAAESRRQGMKFTALYNGDWQSQGYSSQSEADMALCMSLAFWTGKDYRQINNIFHKSGLYRPKWDKVHYAGGITYGERTVSEAIAKCTSVYKDNGRSKKSSTNHDINKDSIVSGIYIVDNAFCMDKNKDVKRLTNFVLEPIESITVDDESRMTAKLINIRGEMSIKQFKFSDLNSVVAFRNAVSANDLRYTVTCSDTELQYIKDYVAQLPCIEKKGFKGIGIDFIDDGSPIVKPVFVCGEGAFGAGFNPADCIVQAPGSVKITSDIHRIEPIERGDLLELGATLIGFNELPKTTAVLCWTAACFIKPHLMRYEIRFPHLVLTGEAGSGKSSTYAKVIRPLMSLDKPLGVGDITPFTFIADAGSSNFLPLVIEEYKPWAMSKTATDMIHSGMRNLYDGQSGERGRADLSVRKYCLTSSLILIGESSPSEAAIKERSIELLFSKADIQEKKDFVRRLDNHKIDIRKLGKSLLLAALNETPGNLKQIYDDCLICVPNEFEPRVRSNIAVLLVGLYLLTKVCDYAGTTFKAVFGIEVAEVKAAVVTAVRDYTLEGGKSKSIIEHTLEIMDRMTPEIIKNECHIRLAPDGKRIAFNFKRIYDPFTLYLKAHNIDAERLSYGAFTAQFRKKGYFAGYANMRMKLDAYGTTNSMAQCFFADAETLREACDVDNILTAVGYSPPKPKQANMFDAV